MKIKGYNLVGRALREQGFDTGFYLMGSPLLQAEGSCIAAGIRMIDVRHEQAAAMMAQAYARVTARPGLCMAASGPGVANFGTGLANALVDCAPVVALGGASAVSQYMSGSFQEIDQVAMMRPVTKWAERCYDTARIPEYIALAVKTATSGKPGPVYLDLPGDVLFREIDEDDVRWPAPLAVNPAYATAAPEAAIDRIVELLKSAKRPLVISGSGVIWSRAADDLSRFVEVAGIPFYTTPQGRGVVPEDSPLCFPTSRSQAFRDADLVIVAGTRLNYMFGYGKPPRFAADARFVRIDIDPDELRLGRQGEVSIAADVGEVLRQLVSRLGAGFDKDQYAGWREQLQRNEVERSGKLAEPTLSAAVPIHPARLCREIRDFIDRDAILAVDGQEILAFGRQVIPTHVAGHRLNSGPFGTMGVGLPFGLGAKAAKPDAQVVVLHGDGSFGFNAMELDTAVRHKLGVVVVISLNGGWTGDPDRKKPGRDLGYTRYDLMAEALGCHGEFVEQPDDIRPALERAARAASEGRPAVVNVVTDWRVNAKTGDFTPFVT
ncbi:MAG: thiamine pyrophosphate-binding protein [Devosia sp.]